MSWDYRVVQYDDGSGFGLHEVYYDKSGNPTKMTTRPCGFVSDDLQGLCGSLLLARGALHSPVVHEAEIETVKKRKVKG